MKILRISHLGIACEGLDKPADMLNRLFGMTSQHTEEVAEQKVRTSFYPVGETTLEYLESTEPEGPVGKFLEKKGPGVHHVAFEVEDVDAAVAELIEKGVRMIDKTPRKGAHGNRIAFIHPAETQGVLIEICQPSGEHC